MVNDVETSFHIYGMNWTDEKVEFYVDDPSNVYLTFTPIAKRRSSFLAFQQRAVPDYQCLCRWNLGKPVRYRSG